METSEVIQTLQCKYWLISFTSENINSAVKISLFSIFDIQVNLIITLSLGSMETDRVIGEPCYNEVIYNRHIAK